MAAFRGTGRVLTAAARSPIHDLLPGSPRHSYDEIAAVLEESCISAVGFLRHGKTAPSPGVDFDRVLNEEGRNQAKQASLAFGRKLCPLFPSVLVSPAPRTVETAEIFLSHLPTTGRVDLARFDALYDGSMTPKGSVLFKKLGYAPLRDYLENENDADRADSQEVLGAYAHYFLDAMVDAVLTTASRTSSGDVSIEKGSTILMVGHAIYLPAAALAVSTLLRCNNAGMITNAHTREAEGYLIDIADKSVGYLVRE